MKYAVCFLIFHLLIITSADSETSKEIQTVSEETDLCIECHRNYSPGIISDWLKSRHAITTPEDAIRKPEPQRRVSTEAFPDHIKSVSVGCYECHSLNADNNADSFEHAGFNIKVIVSPKDCETCHPVEVDQYMGTKKAHAADNLRKNPLYHNMVETITGLREMQDGRVVRLPVSNTTKQETCYACHGTEVKVIGTREVFTDVGDMELPVLSNWPNQGVGRINPDGSRGACTSCHPRHSFSIEIARKPYTCSQCHLEPDVPAWNIYKESKHGNIFLSKQHQWNWNHVPWELGEDFNAPACSVCHNSLITTSDGKTIISRTHDFGSRLWVRIFGLIYSHPQPKKGDTYSLENKDGLPLPVTFDGEFASEYLISPQEQLTRRGKMETLCRSCHGSTWVEQHFTKMDNTIAETDKIVMTTTTIMKDAWDKKIADRSNPFDESIEHEWIKQWLFYANSVRYTSAMPGSPDYAAFKNGWWNLTGTIQKMQAMIVSEQPPVPIREAGPEIHESEEAGFDGVDISELSDADKEYLGLKHDAEPILKNINADIVIFEFMSVYCPSCQMQVPIFNQLYSAIEDDPELQPKVKMIALAVGNNQKETNRFRERREVTFPIIADPEFTVYEALVSSMRTPYTVILKKDQQGNFIIAGSHLGLIRSYETFFAEIKSVIKYNESDIKSKLEEKPIDHVLKKTPFKLTNEELYEKVKEIIIELSGNQNIILEEETIPPSPLMVNPRVFKGISDNNRYAAIAVSRESVCDICHPIQFIYILDAEGEIAGFEPIHLTKYGNKVWDAEDVEKMRDQILGRSILQPMEFNPEVDAVTSATITSAVIFQSLSKGREIFRFVFKQ
jgi:thiol-disulfide isomerase/thioredoxin